MIKKNYRITEISTSKIMTTRLANKNEIQIKLALLKIKPIISPIVVYQKENMYYVIYGNDNVYAYIQLGLTSIAAIIADIEEEEATRIILTELIKDEKLHYFSKIQEIENSLKNNNMRFQDLLHLVTTTKHNILEIQTLMNFSDTERKLITKLGLTKVQALVSSKIANYDLRKDFIEFISKEKLNDNQTIILYKKITEKPKLFKTSLPRDIRLFINSIDNTIKQMQETGFEVNYIKDDNDDCIKCSIEIAKPSE